MHILIDAHLAEKEIDGVARYLIGLLQQLPKIDNSIRYTVLTLPSDKSSLPEDVFAVKNMHRQIVTYHGPTPRQHLFTPRLIREIRPDIYHHPQFDLPARIRVPSVVTIHDLKYLFKPDFLKGVSRLKSLYIRQSVRRSVRKAAHVIVVSNNTLNDLVDFCDLDCKKASVIYHGVDAVRLQKTCDLPDALKIRQPYLLFVGTRRPHKNIEGLIRALGILRNQENIDVGLVVAGKSYADYTAPERLSKQLQLDSFVHFLDYVDDAHLPALFRRAEVFVLPSFYEGFGLPVIEAMVQGIPVVASDVSSLPEIVADSGLLCDPQSPGDIARKISRILSDTKLRDRLVKGGRKRSERFSWSAVAELTLSVYIDILEKTQLQANA